MSDWKTTEELRERATAEWGKMLATLAEPLPCPWCGDMPEVELAFIGCANRNCPCPAKAMELVSLHDDFGPVAQRLLERWNQRPDVADTHRLDALEAFIDENGEAQFTKFLSGCVELDGFCDEGGEDEMATPTFNTLRDLLDELALTLPRTTP